MGIGENLASIRKSLGKAKLVAVTKTRSVDEIRQAASFGVTDIGENRVDEAARKKHELEDLNLRWHMIGHLQRNKVREALAIFDMVQSVDSVRLAREISNRAGTPMPVLLEVNIGGEPQKHGFEPGMVGEVLAEVRTLPNVDVRGLMCMAPFVPAEQTRQYFARMRALFETLSLEILSMGMSNDYKVAVEEGATMVRIGTAIFK